MPSIPLSRYVDVTSGVGGNAGVRERDLVLRIFSSYSWIPANSITEYSSYQELLTAYPAASTEGFMVAADRYFGWVSPNISRAKKISIAAWAETQSNAKIFGTHGSPLLATFTAISSGTLSINMGGLSHTITGIDLTSAVSLSGVAALIQTAIQAADAASSWTAATVTFNAAQGNSFNLTCGSVAPTGNTITISASVTGTDLMDLLGWGAGSYSAPEVPSEIKSVAVARAMGANNNCGSFTFLDDVDTLTSAWNDTQNEAYIYCDRVTPGNAASISSAVVDYSGTALGLDYDASTMLSGTYSEIIPGIQLAATDYSRRNAASNYMYKQFAGFPVSVNSEANANTYDALRVNYIGQTQTAGQNISFYQRGVMTGGSNDATDQNVYANEIWFKDAAATSIINLLLSLAEVPANDQGRGQILAVLQDVINRALFNGVIIAGKTLTTTQKLYITEQTGDENAWHQVQNIGYWVDVVIVPYVTVDSRTEYRADYTIMYSKDDTVRKVNGTHILI